LPPYHPQLGQVGKSKGAAICLGEKLKGKYLCEEISAPLKGYIAKTGCLKYVCSGNPMEKYLPSTKGFMTKTGVLKYFSVEMYLDGWEG